MPLSVVPKKSLGQNFLTSKRVVERIGQVVSDNPTDCVLEIGPGLGFLTKQLLQLPYPVIAIEKDTELFSILSQELEPEITKGNFTLIHKDILDFDPEILKKQGKTYQIAANIPYNITGLIFRKFLTTDFPPKHMTVLIQKEVATRILAKNSKESLLSLSVKAYGTPKLVTHVSRGNFVPAPNVDSTVITINNISKDKFDNPEHEKSFFNVIHAGFAHKRKLLVKNIIDEELSTREHLERIFENNNITLTIRSEDVTLDQWLYISREIIIKNTKQ